MVVKDLEKILIQEFKASNKGKRQRSGQKYARGTSTQSDINMDKFNKPATFENET